MHVLHDLTDEELPDLRTIILPHDRPMNADTKSLRRSPRKAKSTAIEPGKVEVCKHVALSATSNQRRSSPMKPSPAKRSPFKILPQAAAKGSLFDDVPVLPRKAQKSISATVRTIESRQSAKQSRRVAKPDEADSLLFTFSKLAVQSDASDGESRATKKPTKSHESRRLVSARPVEDKRTNSWGSRKPKEVQLGSRFVLDEARCHEDLVDSDGNDIEDEEETDLSGFIVDDDAEISYNESSDEVDSGEEHRVIQKTQKEKPRGRLQRGRRRVDDSEDDKDDGITLAATLGAFKLEDEDKEHRINKPIEIVDLTSPEHRVLNKDILDDTVETIPASRGFNLFEKFKALKLSPPRSSQASEIPSKALSKMWSSSADDIDQDEIKEVNRFTTPPVTPPRSPTKLKSPSKLLSPSKRAEAPMRSPHRQSMDGFWDLNEVNEWHDQFSPKKAPLTSPRKNRLAAFDLWSDGEEDSFEGVNKSSDSLPSPCESPSKSKSRSTSPIKAEKQRLLAEKKSRQAEKKVFEEKKDQMANDLLHALDKHITGSRISTLSASTGGVQIIWSKTLRSTAGRANWRRTVTKASGSPVKGRSDESQPGTTIQHFANIELAVKVIDRPDRLINTLAHEFCHLANFMVSNVRDQPHGTSFQTWARKATAWMNAQTEVPEWKTVQVTTKHSYAIEWKYLWVCVGREQNQAMAFLNLDDEDGCGAEYGRHSKSIDVDTQRCGRCKGGLVQVRPKPRASPVKNLKLSVPAGRMARTKVGKGAVVLEKMVEVIELSD